MNISQHCFVPLQFVKGYYNDSKVFVNSSDIDSVNLFHMDNCNSCVLFRQIASLSPRIGGIFRIFSGQSLRRTFSDQIAQFPTVVSFNPASNTELTASYGYGMPGRMVDFLVYDDPNAQSTLMRLDFTVPDDIIG